MKGQFRIESLYAFIVTDFDGTEGVPALSGDDGMIYPMMGADMTRMDDFRPWAQRMAAGGAN